MGLRLVQLGLPGGRGGHNAWGMSEEVAPSSDRPCTAQPVANLSREACCKAHRFKREVITFELTLPCGICRAFWDITCDPPHPCQSGRMAWRLRPQLVLFMGMCLEFLHDAGSLNRQGRQSSW